MSKSDWWFDPNDEGVAILAVGLSVLVMASLASSLPTTIGETELDKMCNGAGGVAGLFEQLPSPDLARPTEWNWLRPAIGRFTQFKVSVDPRTGKIRRLSYRAVTKEDFSSDLLAAQLDRFVESRGWREPRPDANTFPLFIAEHRWIKQLTYAGKRRTLWLTVSGGASSTYLNCTNGPPV